MAPRCARHASSASQPPPNTLPSAAVWHAQQRAARQAMCTRAAEPTTPQSLSTSLPQACVAQRMQTQGGNAKQCNNKPQTQASQQPPALASVAAAVPLTGNQFLCHARTERERQPKEANAAHTSGMLHTSADPCATCTCIHLPSKACQQTRARKYPVDRESDCVSTYGKGEQRHKRKTERCSQGPAEPPTCSAQATPPALHDCN